MNGMLRLLSIVVAGIGWAVSGYLYFANQIGKFVCPIGACQIVNRSEYAKIGLFPVSIMGIVFYLFILCLLSKVPFFSAKVNRWMLGILLGTGLIFSAYLTYAEVFWIHAICFWCMVSFGCVVVLNILYWLSEKRGRHYSVKNEYI
ncbi:vitamin K epoxide reductase family protein [Bacillus sp. 03113]|uniref:vitamin K epoxide reductase family protein n=1 Tax=Bacillus sp. 03113 TaxID=2578211 RepID=UPI001145189C|nr:vitamin K epoxide reductase family protein [Bacillus sp. 03113]